MNIMRYLLIVILVFLVGCGEATTDQSVGLPAPESRKHSAEISAIESSNQSTQDLIEQLSKDLKKLNLRVVEFGSSIEDRLEVAKGEQNSEIDGLEAEIRKLEEDIKILKQAEKTREATKAKPTAAPEVGGVGTDVEKESPSKGESWQARAIKAFVGKITVYIKQETFNQRPSNPKEGSNTSPVTKEEIKVSSEQMAEHMRVIFSGLQTFIEKRNSDAPKEAAARMRYIESLSLAQWEAIALSSMPANQTLAETLFHRLETNLYPSNKVTPATHETARGLIRISIYRALIGG